MTDRLTRRGGQRTKPLHEALIQETEQRDNSLDATTDSDDDSTHGLPQPSMSTLGMLRCGKQSLCSCATRSVRKRSSSISSWCPNPITHGWHTVNRLYSSLTQYTLSPSSASSSSSEVLVEEQHALTMTKQAEADDETPETRSSPDSSPASGAPKVIQIINHQATERFDDDSKLLVSNETSSFNALTTLDTPPVVDEDECCTLASSEKSAASRLPDYTKCVATLPDISPLECLYQTDQQQRHAEDDDSSAADLDFFPPVEHPSDIKVHFFLRMPIASKLMSGRPRSDVPQNILSKSTKHSTASTPRAPRANKKASRRTSSSSDNMSADSNDYVVPLGNPGMSRENSVEHLEKMGNDWAGFRSPIQKRRGSMENSLSPPVVESNDLGTHPAHESDERVVPLKDNEYGIITPLRSETSDDEGLGYGYRQAYSDSDLVTGDHYQKNEPRQKKRMQRRSSFVAGSKIERFDCTDHSTSQNQNKPPNNRQRRRGRKQRGGTANDTASYTEWKIDLMVNGYTSNKASSHDYERS
jgi:hypothetical protein